MRQLNRSRASWHARSDELLEVRATYLRGGQPHLESIQITLDIGIQNFGQYIFSHIPQKGLNLSRHTKSALVFQNSTWATGFREWQRRYDPIFTNRKRRVHLSELLNHEGRFILRKETCNPVTDASSGGDDRVFGLLIRRSEGEKGLHHWIVVPKFFPLGVKQGVFV